MEIRTDMAAANLLIVSDLHFGEELLPGASMERRHAIELGAAAFREFLRYHTVRRRDGRTWRLVIAGDLFDFMSVVIPATRERRRSAVKRSRSAQRHSARFSGTRRYAGSAAGPGGWSSRATCSISCRW